jgi:D-glycerate 3-kinase
MYTQLIENFVEQESLPESYGQDAAQYFVPLAERIAALILKSKQPLFVGINGAQGTGKTTLSKLLIQLLEARDFNIASFSIDDFYLSKKERQELARTKHPLLITRGVPGTHDMALLQDTLSRLLTQQQGQFLTVPRFDKALDDRAARADWKQVDGAVDAIILEGWCVAVTPQEAAALANPINALEAEEDSEKGWREFVNSQLADHYQSVFKQIQFLIMLKAPSFKQIFEWRKLQEEKLRRMSSLDASAIMNEEQLQRFIQHYERLTRHCLQSLPENSDVLFELDTSHQFANATGLDN